MENTEKQVNKHKLEIFENPDFLVQSFSTNVTCLKRAWDQDYGSFSLQYPLLSTYLCLPSPNQFPRPSLWGSSSTIRSLVQSSREVEWGYWIPSSYFLGFSRYAGRLLNFSDLEAQARWGGLLSLCRSTKWCGKLLEVENLAPIQYEFMTQRAAICPIGTCRHSMWSLGIFYWSGRCSCSGEKRRELPLCWSSCLGNIGIARRHQLQYSQQRTQSPVCSHWNRPKG